MRGKNFRQRVAQVFDPGLDLGIQILARRVDGVQVQFLQAVLGQHPHQAAVAQAIDGRINRQHTYAHAAADRGFHGVGGVDHERRAGDVDHLLAFRAIEQPLFQRDHRADHAQAGVLEQVGRFVRQAMAGDVGGRRADDAVGDAQALRNEPRVRQLGGQHDGHVIALVKQVGHAVGHGQVEGHVGVRFTVAGNRIHHEMLAHPGHRMHLQLPGGARMGVAGLGLGFLDVGQNLFAAHQVALAGLGQRNAAGGTVEQPCLQMGFQVGDRPRYVRGGGVQLRRSGREAA